MTSLYSFMRPILSRFFLHCLRQRSIMTESITDIHTEGLAKIHAPKPASKGKTPAPSKQVAGTKSDVFLNPVQCYNRDLSILAINTYCATVMEERKAAQTKKKGKAKQNKSKRAIDEVEMTANKKRKISNHAEAAESLNASLDHSENAEVSTESSSAEFKDPKTFTIFEGLAATGLRSIRYALEIPKLGSVIANDLSSTAVEAMRRNIELNRHECDLEQSQKLDKIKVSEGDCLAMMYTHRSGKERFDIIDLDPYGTAAPFVDAAVQSVTDGGLLCVTCTDLAVLASSNYPEKCFSNYGGVPIKAEYCHEGALRLVLHTISTSAARYGRYIKPQLSLSIDFYLRVFVRVYTGALGTKEAFVNTAMVSVCSHCQASTLQSLGRKETISPNNVKHKLAGIAFDSSRCIECQSHCHIAGPMWSGRLHEPDFVARMLDTLDTDQASFNTASRMKGMLTIAQKELETPFYFTASTIASSFRASSPSLASVVNALLHAGYKASRSHACSGAIKTDAPRSFINDLMRTWIKSSAPVSMQNISENSPARVLLGKDANADVNFDKHEETAKVLMKDIKLVFYQANPANWGPGKKAIA